MPDNNKPAVGKLNLKGELHPDQTCRICGARLYCTDHGNHEATYHCSSDQARFWDFPRGSKEQEAAKNHWDASRVEEYVPV